ncbi:MAG: molybdopterin-binding protein [Chloroflexota bacterium]
MLTRDLSVGGEAWSKGRRLSAADLDALATAEVLARGAWAGTGRDPGSITLLLPDADDLHEDEAARRLADAVAGAGVTLQGPAESRVDLVARHDGVLRVQVPVLERIDRLDGLSVFTALDGQVVAGGALVASVKTGPHLVDRALLERAETIVARRRAAVVDVRPFRPARIGALVRESLPEPGRRRFEAGLQTRVTALGSRLTQVAYVGEAPDAVTEALRHLATGPTRVDVLLTAGAGSTDPQDPVFEAIGTLGGRVISHGVPAHPGSMLILARLWRTTILGLPTCGAYSKATAVDLLLPWLLSGEPPTRATVARLGHGGVLTRDQRFRFPAYAQQLDAPGG